MNKITKELKWFVPFILGSFMRGFFGGEKILELFGEDNLADMTAELIEEKRNH